MSYEIIITETRDVLKTQGKNWAVIGSEEVERKKSIYDIDSDNPSKTRVSEVMGYTPEIEKTVEESRVVLKQTLDELDLPAVIKAVNGI